MEAQAQEVLAVPDRLAKAPLVSSCTPLFVGSGIYHKRELATRFVKLDPVAHTLQYYATEVRRLVLPVLVYLGLTCLFDTFSGFSFCRTVTVTGARDQTPTRL